MFRRSSAKSEPEVLLEQQLHAHGGRQALAQVVTDNRVELREGLATAGRTFGVIRETIHEMTVRVDPAPDPPFEAALTVKTRLTDDTAPLGYPPIEVGLPGRVPTIPVIYDATDHRRIAYDRSPEAALRLAEHIDRTRPDPPRQAPVRTDITMEMEALSELLERNELTPAEFERQRRDLLES